jgi:single-stranded DNA-binding protein
MTKQDSSAKETPMAGGVNRTILVGVVGKYGVEVRYANNGTAWASFTLIATEQGQDGREHSTLIPCECWGKKAEAAGELEAGTPVRAPAPALTGTTT